MSATNSVSADHEAAFPENSAQNEVALIEEAAAIMLCMNKDQASYESLRKISQDLLNFYRTQTRDGRPSFEKYADGQNNSSVFEFLVVLGETLAQNPVSRAQSVPVFRAAFQSPVTSLWDHKLRDDNNFRALAGIVSNAEGLSAREQINYGMFVCGVSGNPNKTDRKGTWEYPAHLQQFFHIGQNMILSNLDAAKDDECERLLTYVLKGIGTPDPTVLSDFANDTASRARNDAIEALIAHAHRIPDFEGVLLNTQVLSSADPGQQSQIAHLRLQKLQRDDPAEAQCAVYRGILLMDMPKEEEPLKHIVIDLYAGTLAGMNLGPEKRTGLLGSFASFTKSENGLLPPDLCAHAKMLYDKIIENPPVPANAAGRAAAQFLENNRRAPGF